MSGRAGLRAWVLLAGVLAAAAVGGIGGPLQGLDWEPRLAFVQPWRWWTAAMVHWSPWHLVANLAGLALVAALGVLARVTPGCALAWAIAWPLGHLGLLMRPDLVRYGGLSGVLHAGVAVVAWHLLRWRRGRDRWVGAALLIGTAAKVILEAPWGPPLRHPPDWDIPIAPLAHATGALAGLALAVLLDRPSSEETK